MTSNVMTDNISIDRARRILCRHIGQWCKEGVNNVKVRINTINDEPQGAWFYGRVENEWLKLAETVEGPEIARLITVESERLAASPYSEECQVRRKWFRDRTEFEIKFHHDKIVAHQGKRLSSYLYGILFHERHTPPDSLRQGARRGPRRQVSRF